MYTKYGIKSYPDNKSYISQRNNQQRSNPNVFSQNKMIIYPFINRARKIHL